MTSSAERGGRARRGSAARRLGAARLVRRGALLLAGALVVTGAWLGVRVVLVHQELTALLAVADRAREIVRPSAEPLDLERVLAEADAVSRHAASIVSLTDDPVWRTAEALPLAGSTLHATRLGVQALGEAVDGARPLLSVTAEVAASLRLDGEHIDARALSRVGEPLLSARAALIRAHAAVAAIDRDSVIPRVARPLDRLEAELAAVLPVFSSLAPAAQIAGAMLGADEPRLILVMLQNNAELRMGGGITGTFFAVRAREGRLELVGHADSSAFPTPDGPVAAVPDALVIGSPSKVGRFVPNITMTPDFPLSASLASAWWRLHSGLTPDAVVSIDPSVLATVLEVVGPLDVDGVRVDAVNLVDTLLRAPYLTLSHDDQTGFFRDVSEAVIEAALDSATELPRLAAALGPLAERGRISVWSAHPEEQAVIARTPAAGMLARLSRAGDEGYALLFDNLTGSKLDAYLDARLALEAGACRPDGRAQLVLTASLSSGVPQSVEIPWRAAPGFGGFAREDVALRVTALAPAGAVPEGAWIDGEPVRMMRDELDGRPAGVLPVVVRPGQRVELELRFTAPPGAGDDPVLLHTPLVADADVATSGTRCG
ncbi:DUF4012 domain-containing protein [Microbacterium album]|uniref:DUF4012 domain-containing protein n=1 Tax=Microbacterium album TaxID=2053191 RepID=A0A917IGY2_9MICO|nr:DUF4012 domain-containing protein [Microbacterium album]GGH48986.1 hypothetical protein GCM10010921_26860 [Microbacterium album]